MDLLQETRKLARASDQPAAKICKAAKIKPRWYYRFLAGDFKEPGIAKIQRLHAVLNGGQKKHDAR